MHWKVFEIFHCPFASQNIKFWPSLWYPGLQPNNSFVPNFTSRLESYDFGHVTREFGGSVGDWHGEAKKSEYVTLAKAITSYL